MSKKSVRKTSLFSNLNTTGTIFSMDFDFTNANQEAILKQLQAGGYNLLGYKGAVGPNQVTAGLPTWFAEPCAEMFGMVEIDYEPMYEVYVFNEANIAANTTIKMESLSIPLPLGTAVTFEQDGSFTVSGSAPAGTITVFNNRPASTSNVTIGLAALVNGAYAPFCAFTCTPQGSVSMEPIENVCLFVANTGQVSGSVVGNATAPGCTFEFNSSCISYELAFIAGTLGITNAPGGLPVTETTSGANLSQLLNTPS
jgi:hypothetical protein